ncbi:MAG: hypothetical protein ACXWUG_28460 [Polyangiales bacterium]
MSGYRAGQSVEDFCRVCKEPRDHRVIAVGGAGEILRVICGYCGSQHNYRGGRTPGERTSGGRVSGVREERAGSDSGSDSDSGFDLVSDRERIAPPIDLEGDVMDIEQILRRVIREESGLTPVPPADKWRGGEIVLKPGKPGLQEKTIPIETFFHKVVMLRNRLRVLEQQINASALPDDEKVKLQSYITGCYGSLTTFNILFADEADKFKGSSSGD